MISVARCVLAPALAALALLATLPGVQAADVLRIVSGTKGDWDVSVPEYGLRAGIFAKHGITPEISYSNGTADTLKAVISNSVDIGNGVGVVGFLAPAAKGAPIKMISAQYTGAPDLEWYVRADNAIRGFKDIKDDTTIAYSTNGSSSHITLLALLNHFGVKGRPVASGNQSAILTALMSGQIDVGYDSDGGLSLGDARTKVRTIGSGADLPSFRDLTVRALITNNENLSRRRDVLIRFLSAYHETIDWMYDSPDALKWFAEEKHASLEEARRVRDLIYPKSGMRLGPISGADLSIRQAFEFKRIDTLISPEQFARLQDILWASPK